MRETTRPRERERKDAAGLRAARTRRVCTDLMFSSGSTVAAPLLSPGPAAYMYFLFFSENPSTYFLKCVCVKCHNFLMGGIKCIQSTYTTVPAYQLLYISPWFRAVTRSSS